jgi:hypothetical protein
MTLPYDKLAADISSKFLDKGDIESIQDKDVALELLCKGHCKEYDSNLEEVWCVKLERTPSSPISLPSVHETSCSSCINRP